MPEMLAGLLHGDSIVLATAANGGEALDMVSREKFDLILLDLGLPDTNGFELLQRLKADAALQSVPVIVLTDLSLPGADLANRPIGQHLYQIRPIFSRPV